MQRQRRERQEALAGDGVRSAICCRSLVWSSNPGSGQLGWMEGWMDAGSVPMIYLKCRICVEEILYHRFPELSKKKSMNRHSVLLCHGQKMMGKVKLPASNRL